MPAQRSKPCGNTVLFCTPENLSLTTGGRAFMVPLHASSAELSKDDMILLNCTTYGESWPGYDKHESS